MLIFSKQKLSKSRRNPPPKFGLVALKKLIVVKNFDEIFPNFAEHFLAISISILIFTFSLFCFHFGSIAQARELNWRTQNPTFPNQISN